MLKPPEAGDILSSQSFLLRPLLSSIRVEAHLASPSLPLPFSSQTSTRPRSLEAKQPSTEFQPLLSRRRISRSGRKHPLRFVLSSSLSLSLCSRVRALPPSLPPSLSLSSSLLLQNLADLLLSPSFITCTSFGSMLPATRTSPGRSLWKEETS